MKDIKQIRENYLVLEKEDAEQKKLTTLVRAGLFDAKKLPILKRALKKDASSMTPAEKNLLIDLLDNLMSQVLHSQQVYMKVRSNVSKKEAEELKEAADYLSKFDPRIKPGYNENTDKQIPAVLILRRKAIRIYPDNQKVALYYSQALDQYVTIPFGIEGSSGPARLREDVQIDELSQDLEKKAYLQRLAQTQGDDDSPEAAAKRAIAGVKASRTLKRIGKKRGEIQRAGVKATGTQMLKNIEAEKKPIKRQVSSGWEGVGNLIAHAAVDTGRGIARLAGVPKRKLRFEEQADIKTRFKVRLEEKRQEQIDEALPLLGVLGGAALRAAPYIGRGIAGAGRLAGRALRGAGRFIRRGAPGLAGSLLGGGGGSEDAARQASDAASATAKSLGPQQAREYQFKGGMAGGKVGAPGTRDTVSATTQGDFRSPADQVKYMNAMMREGVETVQLSFNEETVTINNSTAEKVLNVYNSLNEENRNKFEQMLNENAASFKKAVNFALRY